MARMLIVIPIMFTQEELKKTLGQVPADFEEASSEFWSYIKEKLEPFLDKIYTVYSEKPSSSPETENQVDTILKRFKIHAKFNCIDDPLLVAEAEAWLELTKKQKKQMVIDLFEESMSDRNKHASEVINKTLVDGGIGILFIDSARKLAIPADIKVVRMCPFDPLDYLNRYLVKLKTENRRTTSSNKPL